MLLRRLYSVLSCSKALKTLQTTQNILNLVSKRAMANSKFEYVKQFESDEILLPNCWVVVRLDGKGFHKFSSVHNFAKPNDPRSLNLMNRAAVGIMEEFNNILFAYGQSDEYSFIFKKDTSLYNRRKSKIMTTVTSMFTSLYVYHWDKYFDSVKLIYPPCFDGRCVLYPSDENLIDYMSWRQADVHINNLYNTCFWNLVQKDDMKPVEAEEHLCGTVSSYKNELLFSKYNINYNNEPPMYKKGTILLRKQVIDPLTGNRCKVIMNYYEDMIKDAFWKKHWELLDRKGTIQMVKASSENISPLVMEQLERRRHKNKDIRVENLQINDAEITEYFSE